MWRLAEVQDGARATPVADFRSEEHGRALYHDICHTTNRVFSFYQTEGLFTTPLEWRVWSIGRRGTPETLLVACTLRALAEAYIRDRRPIAEEWALFRLCSNGDQDRYTLNGGGLWTQDGPAAPPPPPQAIYHAVELQHRQLGNRFAYSTNYDIVASFADEAAARAYIDDHPGQLLQLMSTIGLDADPKPVPPVVAPTPVSSEPRPRRRALRI